MQDKGYPVLRKFRVVYQEGKYLIKKKEFTNFMLANSSIQAKILY